MISDSPYRSGDLMLKPLEGLLAGMGGALLMLALLQVFNPVSHMPPGLALTRIGLVAVPADATSEALMAMGLALHLAVAGLLGLLYALSQRRIPDRGLIGVGLLFGFVIWAVGSLIIGRFLEPAVREVLRSWPWLLAHLLYGLTLTAAAIYQGRRRGQGEQPVVRD